MIICLYLPINKNISLGYTSFYMNPIQSYGWYY